MRSIIGLLVLVGIFIASTGGALAQESTPGPIPEITSEGCEQVAAYGDDLRALADDLRAEWDRVFGSGASGSPTAGEGENILALLRLISAGDLREAAEAVDLIVVEFNKLQPPTVAVVFHDELERGLGILSAFLKDAETEGLLSAGIDWFDELRTFGDRIDEIESATIAACPEFEAAVSELFP